MNSIILHGPEEALVLIPHLLGHRPTHNLIFLALESRGEDASRTRTCLGPLINLDLEETPLDMDMAGALARTLRGSGIAHAVLVLHCGDLDLLGPEELDTLSMIGEAVDEAMGEPAAKTFATYATDAREWGIVVDGAMSRRPWSQLESRPVAAELVYAGSAPIQEHPHTRVIARRTRAERMEAQDCGDAWLCTHLMGDVPDLRLGCMEWDHLLSQWADPVERERIRDVPFVFGRANMALRNVGVRDRLLHYGVDPARGFPLVEVSSADLARGLARSMRARPDVAHLENLVDLLGECAAFASQKDAAALSAAAHLLWWYGQNSRARLYVDEALAADATYPLAQLLADALCAKVQPEWLRTARGS